LAAEHRRGHRRAGGALALAAAVLAMAGVEAGASVEVDPPIDAGEARAFWRWIGLRSEVGAPCPPAEGWASGPLFALPDTPLPPGLAPYCLYELPPDASASPALVNNLTGLVTAGVLTAVQPDAMAVAAEGVLEELLGDPLSQHFLEEAGQPVAATWPRPAKAVRLAFVDTQPTRETDPETFVDFASGHGFALVTMAKQLLCAGTTGDCAAQVTSRLALAFTCFDRITNLSSCRRDSSGGWIGLQSDVATALRREVTQWLAETPPVPPPGVQPHLVLNLSLGWSGRFGGPEAPPSLPPAAAAVYAALEDASCRGALVFAAAGNTHGGPDEPAGPIYPGGWEARRAPSRARCQSLLETGAYVPDYAFPAPGQPDRRSLVYAAGGVRADDTPIFNARQNAEPALVAFADHAIAASLAVAGETTPTLTGTSVGTAVVSAAAAAVWQLRDSLDVPRLLRVLSFTGTDTGRDADFCLGGRAALPCPANPPPAVSRVRVCAATDCVSGKGCTAPFPGCPARNGLDLSAVKFDEILFPAVVDLTDLWTSTAPAECDPLVTRYDPALAPPENPCPSQQFHGVNATPWSGPEPGDPPCPTCAVRFASPGTLYFEIDPHLTGPFTDATLVCGETAYSLDLGVLRPGRTGAVLNFGELARDGEVQCPDTSPIWLEVRDAQGSSRISPLLYLD
jgi:hypothetical protein